MDILNSNVNGVVPGPGGLRAGYYSEAPGVAAAKFAVMAWLEKNPQAARYIRKLRGDSSYAGPRALFRFFKWLVKQPGWSPQNGMGEVEYVLSKQGHMGSDQDRAELENLLLDFCNNEIKGTKNYKLKFYNVFHGLLKYHKIQLPNSDISEINGDTPPVHGNLSMDEIRRIVEACKLREKAIFSLIFQGIMDEERFTIVNHGWRVLEPQLKDNREWITFRFEYRKKNDNPYFTMWHRDGDAIRFLKEYLKERGTPKIVRTDSRGEPAYEPIFLNRQKQPFNKDNLKQAWLEAGTRAGVVNRPQPFCKKCGLPMRKTRRSWGNGEGGVKRYECICGNMEPAANYYGQFSKFRSGKNLHEIRDTVKTMIPNLAGVDRTLVAFFAGHQIDPLDYEKLRDAEEYGLMDEIHKKWSKALPYLNLWSQAGHMTTNTREITDLKEEIGTLRTKMLEGEEERRKMMQYITSGMTKGADPQSPEQFERLRRELLKDILNELRSQSFRAPRP
jgi:hypothetical protein